MHLLFLTNTEALKVFVGLVHCANGAHQKLLTYSRKLSTQIKNYFVSIWEVCANIIAAYIDSLIPNLSNLSSHVCKEENRLIL